MPLPFLPAMVVTGRILSQVLRRWQGALALIGLVATGGFTLSHFVREAGATALSLWPLLLIACSFWLAKEVVRAYFKLEGKKVKVREDQ